MSTPSSLTPALAPDLPARQVRGPCRHDCPDTCAPLTPVDRDVAIQVQGNLLHRHLDGMLLCAKAVPQTVRDRHTP